MGKEESMSIPEQHNLMELLAITEIHRQITGIYNVDFQDPESRDRFFEVVFNAVEQGYFTDAEGKRHNLEWTTQSHFQHALPLLGKLLNLYFDEI